MHFSLEFFNVTAQLTPVLFLTLVLEKRYQKPTHDGGDRATRSTAIALLVVAELISLEVVARQQVEHNDGAFVTSALLLGGLLLVFPVLADHWRAAKGQRLAWLERVAHAVSGAFIFGAMLITWILAR